MTNETLQDENAKLKAALARLNPWAGESRDGPDWATPEAKTRNRAKFEHALNAACECFPDNSIISPDGTSILFEPRTRE